MWTDFPKREEQNLVVLRSSNVNNNNTKTQTHLSIQTYAAFLFQKSFSVTTAEAAIVKNVLSTRLLLLQY